MLVFMFEGIPLDSDGSAKDTTFTDFKQLSAVHN